MCRQRKRNFSKTLDQVNSTCFVKSVFEKLRFRCPRVNDKYENFSFENGGGKLSIKMKTDLICVDRA